MGKIFGISDLPVSTIMTPFDGVKVPLPKEQEITSKINKNIYSNLQDTFVSKKVSPKSNPILKMRNGIGKLMKHFSKPIGK